MTKKILLVDDDIDDQSIFQSALETICQTAELVMACDGVDALSKIKDPVAVLPDIIFTDLNMPRMNGFGFLESIKKLECCHTIPVIVYSTSSSPHDINTCKSLGAVAYMVKPSYFTQLCRELETILKNMYIL